MKLKDKQIEKLTKLVKDKKGNGDIQQEIMAISPEADDEGKNYVDVEEEEQGVFDRGTKIGRAEWLMAQVDLDPIESHGSMEMSTTKFKSIGGKRFINSDRGPIDDSQNSNFGKPPVDEKKTKKAKEQQSKKSSKQSYESQFIDVSEDRMRSFVMD